MMSKRDSEEVKKTFPIYTKIGWMSEPGVPEGYDLIDHKGNVKVWRKESNYHPILEILQEDGSVRYYAGLMPG